MNTTRAIQLAEFYHDGQMYGDVPYVHHLQDVVRNVTLRGGGEELQQIAWLHDIIEDTACTLLILESQGFRRAVRAGVEAITKWPALSYDEYIVQVKSDVLALEVKKCDTMANLTQSFDDGDEERISKYTKQLINLNEPPF